MFVNMAFVNPSRGKEDEMISRMHDFAKSLEIAPDLLGIHVLSEIGGNTLLGISMWKDKESFDRAMANLAAGPSSASKSEALRENPPIARQFKEI